MLRLFSAYSHQCPDLPGSDQWRGFPWKNWKHLSFGVYELLSTNRASLDDSIIYCDNVSSKVSYTTHCLLSGRLGFHSLCFSISIALLIAAIAPTKSSIRLPLPLLPAQRSFLIV